MAILEYPSWDKLARNAEIARQYSLRALFAEDAGRATRFSTEAAGLYLDYSKNLIDEKTLELFANLTAEAGLVEAIRQMVDGQQVNITERRAALHTLLRKPLSEVPKHLVPQATQISETLDKMKQISDDIRQRTWRGHSGKAIKDIVHLGIGGSYLGTRMIDESLKPMQTADINVHYIANVDGQHISEVLAHLDASQTLVIIVSKSFDTVETITNATTAKQWLLSNMSIKATGQHLLAITANVDAAAQFGVRRENMLPIWDWVGGRYSLWSAVSLPIAIRYGSKSFDQLLQGAAAMDRHFTSADMPHNMPMILAMLGIWYQHFFNAGSHAILPYDHGLRLLPEHLQQLEMESNGKSIRNDGDPVEYPTAPIIWGGEGTNGQHAFHQLLHQGTRFVSIDFILPLVPHHQHIDHHDKLVANCLSQSQALMLGRNISEITDAETSLQKQHKQMPGNRPSNTILLDQVTPQSLGALIALYEHKVFCQAVFWQINPFDQWGVEFGKELGDVIYSAIENGDKSLDASTDTLLKRYQSAKNQAKLKPANKGHPHV